MYIQRNIDGFSVENIKTMNGTLMEHVYNVWCTIDAPLVVISDNINKSLLTMCSRLGRSWKTISNDPVKAILY